ncbi:MAG: hypothetical protein ACHP7P_11090 [Terriglobales bacterium]
MRPSILLTMLLTALFVIASGCGNVAGCPTCGTTKADGYVDIVNIAVPEHNPTGEPGGPFNSFDISWVDPVHHLFYVSDRIGLDIPVVDTLNNITVNAIQGFNSVSGAGFQASLCDQSILIPPIVDVFGNFTRFGCRTGSFHLVSGFGANGFFGGFPGAQCCASRANGVNPMSGPDGLLTTPDGNFLVVGNGSSSVVVFDLTTMDLTKSPPTAPTVIATIPTGVSADYDGPTGIAGCVASWNGEAGSAADCGDDRADEMAYDPVHKVLGVINGDPGFPFVTFIDMSGIVNRTPGPAGHCLPIDATTPYGPSGPGFPSQGLSTAPLTPATGTSFNPPSCIIGQIYYDGAGGSMSGGLGLTSTVPVDNVGTTFPCPDPSNPQTFGGVSGSAAASLIPGVGITPSGGAYTIPCHHAPIVDQTKGTFCSQTLPAGTCAGAIAPAGLGGNAWWHDTSTGKSFFLQANLNSVPVTSIGSIDVIDPRLGNPNGPIVVNSFVTPNCMPASVVQGPGNNFLIGCGDHDGEAFPPNMIVVSLSPDPVLGAKFTQLAEITQVGGVDEIWYNPGDNKYYLAARDMPNGPVMGVIDAATNVWLQNVSTNANSHSIAVDPSNNHAFVPMQSGAPCAPSLSSNGCVGVFAQQ